MSELDDVTLTDIARRAEVRLSAASNWRTRHRDFPPARLVEGREVFAASGVAKYLDKRRIPKNALKDDEASGAVYGDRFRRNTGSSAAPVATTGAPAARNTAENVRRLSAVLESLAGVLDPGTHIEYVLGLLHLKAHDPTRWGSLVSARSWTAARDVLVEERTAPWHDRAGRPFEMIKHSTPAEPLLLDAITAVDRIVPAEGTGRVVAELAEELLEHTEHTILRRGGHFTPEPVVRTLVSILAPKDTDEVLDPFCGSAELLVAADRAGGTSAAGAMKPRLHGRVTSERSLRVSALNLALHGIPADLRLLGEDADEAPRFDVVLANPPFNLSRTTPAQAGDPQTGERTENFAWLRHAVSRLVPGGRAGVLMPNTTVASEDARESALREQMVRAGEVECIVALPGQLFRSTEIAATIWVLRRPREVPEHPEVLFIDATDLPRDDFGPITREHAKWRAAARTGTYRGVADFSRSAGIEEIHARGYVLHPRTYVKQRSGTVKSTHGLRADLGSKLRDLRHLKERSNTAHDALEERLTTLHELLGRSGPWDLVPLGDIARIVVGPSSLAREGTPAEGTRVVLPRNIRPHELVDDEDEWVTPLIAEDKNRFALAVDDIVCARTGTVGRYALVRPPQAGRLIGPGCVLVRGGTRVHAEYLVHHLNAAHSQNWLREAIKGGTAIRYITKKTLASHPVSLPPLAVQREISALLNDFALYVDAQLGVKDVADAARKLILPMLSAEQTGGLSG